MDIASAPGIAALATNMSNAKLTNEVGIAVMKKALDLESESAQQLIQAIPTPTSGGSLGSNIDVMA